MEKNIDNLLNELTLGEKSKLCAGLGLWNTKPIERLGIPSIMLTDGPIGIRKQVSGQDNLGVQESIKTTCFPAGATIACSWDKNLLREMGEALGKEALYNEVGVLLGPAINIKRTPLCGRNFEYLSEDPILTGELATAYVEGVQSQGVGTSLKHYAANNQEFRRTSIDTIVDERTLREIYLTAFEMVVKRTNPATIMAAYNRVNGEFACENNHLLNEILREEWGFQGLVMSDWDATNDRIKGLKNGLDLRMPCMSDKDEKDIKGAIEDGTLTMEALDLAVKRNLVMIMNAAHNSKSVNIDIEKHHRLVRKIASESMVLLKNQENILPLSKKSNIAVIGDMAVNVRFQGGGSSHIAPTKVDNILEEIKSVAKDANILFARGYDENSDKVDTKLFEEAKKVALKSDVVVIFAGLPERYESEGYDREHMDIPSVQNKLIEKICNIHKKVVVVLFNGSVVSMPWNKKVQGILEAYLGGQAIGGAIADVLFGDVNPSGKLAESFPADIRHNPSYISYPGYEDRVEYTEGVFVGYRYYLTKNIKPLFSFGYGLSYTSFTYKDIRISKEKVLDNETVDVLVTVRNSGNVFGKEVVQLYVKDVISSIPRPELELKHFEKISLQPGEEKIVKFTLDFRDFAFFDIEKNDYSVESGEFEICIGSSCEDINFKNTIYVESTSEVKKSYTKISNFADVMKDEYAWTIVKEAAMRNPFYRMVLSGQFQNSDPKKVLGYTLLRVLVDNEIVSEQEFDEMLNKINI